MADILIRFDEFPASCDVCPFVGTNDDLMPDDYRYLYCGFPYMGEFVTDYEISRHPDCPLHELPPHGDLIDMDKIRYTELYGGVEVTTANWIDSLPVIVPAEREGEDAPD